jgi:endonuclease/exonuclease/phosphatase family metal-dependent hydrolase
MTLCRCFHRLIAISLVLAWTAGAVAHAQLPHEIRILTYNIRHGEGMDHKVDLDRIADVIRDAKPDLVALEEVDQGTDRTDHVDQPAELGRLTGMQAVFGHNIDFQGGGYGTAVLSRLPIQSHESHKLKSFYEGTAAHPEQRGVQLIVLGSDADKLVFLCTHLDYRPDDSERFASVTTINELADKFSGKPVILAGDLNALPDSRVIGEFDKTWKRAGTNDLLTFPADDPKRLIDYVYVRPVDGWEIVEVRVIEEPVASDHRPLLVVARHMP